MGGAAVTPPAEGSAAKEGQPALAPEMDAGGDWFNRTLPGDLSYDGKVTLVYFWDYTTINAIRELGHLQRWYELYHPYGFSILMIHTPEFLFAKKHENVEKALRRFKIRYPVYLDNELKMWTAFKTRSWPTKYLVGPGGRILHEQIGEGQYASMEREIRKALRVLNPDAVFDDRPLEEETDPFNTWECGDMSTEIYTGFKRAGWWGVEIANRTKAAPDQTVMFLDRGERLERGFFLSGKWTNREDYFLHARNTEKTRDYLGLIYVAREVYGVLGVEEKETPVRAYIYRNGEPVPPPFRGGDVREDEAGGTYVLVDEPRLYYLIENERPAFQELKVASTEEGLAVYAFYFSNRCLSDFQHL